MTVSTEVCESTRVWTTAGASVAPGFRAQSVQHFVVKDAVSGQILTRGVHFNVVDDGVGGHLIAPIAAALAPPRTLLIRRETPALQGCDLSSTAMLDVQALENELDAGAYRDAEIRRNLASTSITADLANAKAEDALGQLADLPPNHTWLLATSVQAQDQDEDKVAMSPKATWGVVNTAGSRIAALEASVSAPNAQRYLTIPALQAATVPATVQAVELLSGAAIGDGAGGLWVRTALTASPSVMSADGAYWRRQPTLVLDPIAGGANSLEWRSTGAALSSLSGYVRSWFDSYGMYYTQGWMTISGLYNDLGNNRMQLVPAGATHANPNYVGFNEIISTNGMLTISQDVIAGNITFQDNGLSGGSPLASNVRVATAGSGYVVGDVLTIVGGSPLAEQPTQLKVIAMAGTGYAVNDIVVIAGGDPITRTSVRVTQIGAGGKITQAQIENAGEWRRYPLNITETSQFSTSGAGTEARFIFRWPRDGATKLTVSEVDPTTGAILDVNVLVTGRYNPGQSPPATAAVTGGTGTGATFLVDWSLLGVRSRQFDALNTQGLPTFSLEGDGRIFFGPPEGSNTRQDHVAQPNWLGWTGKGRIGTPAYFSARRGFLAPPDSINQIGNDITYSGRRTVSAGAGDAVHIGRITMWSASVARVTLASITGVWEFVIPHVWQSGLNIDGGQNFAGTWAEVPATTKLVQVGQRDLAVDVQQDASTGELRFRIRAPDAAAAVTVDFQITVTGALARDAEAGQNVLRKFCPATTTETGVAVPTRLWVGAPKTRSVRHALFETTPATGANVLIPEGCPRVVLTHSATIASLTVTLPGGFADGQTITITTKAPITSLSVAASGAGVVDGYIGAAAAWQSIAFSWRRSTSNWQRI